MGRRDPFIALAGRVVRAFGEEVTLVALTLGLQAGGGRPYVEVLP